MDEQIQQCEQEQYLQEKAAQTDTADNKKVKISGTTFVMLLTLGVLVLWLCILLIFRTNSAVCERICRTLVNAYVSVAGRFYSVVGFNVFEVLATLCVIGVIGGIVASIVLFCKKYGAYSRRVLIVIAIAAVWVANLYVFVAGFAYNRERAPIPVYESKTASTEVAVSTYIAAIEDFNSTVEQLGTYPDGRAICPYTDKQLREVIRDAYERLVTDDYYFDYTAKAKPVISSGIMASFGIMGISFVPTAEAGYNKDMPMVEKASTIAHEFAHIHGVMREDEANALAAYVLLNSGDAYLKYSFYLDNMGFLFTFICYNVDPNYYTVNYPTHSAYRIEKEYCRKWWDEHDFMTVVGNFFNDLYLKLQGQEDGTGSYVELPEIDGEETVDEEGNVIINYNIMYNTIQRIVLDYYD